MNNYDVSAIPFEVVSFWNKFITKVEYNNHQTMVVVNDLRNYASKIDNESAEYISVNRLNIKDWIGPNIGYADEGHIITDRFVTDKHQYLENLEERVQWIFKLSYAQCYEEFERFWKNVLHFYLEVNCTSSN